jgi:DNA-binding SARP family transcriptional activator
VHHVRADQVLATRQRALDAAYAANPQRFVNGRPVAEHLADAVWINPPEDRSRKEVQLH